MKVYYGWARMNNAQKRESLAVIFLNSDMPPRLNKDGKDGVTRYLDVCYVRNQTSKEEEDAKHQNRVYSVYNIFMDDKRICGSLFKALQVNSEADKNNVSQAERKRIYEALKAFYLKNHKGYNEPGYQLSFNF